MFVVCTHELDFAKLNLKAGLYFQDSGGSLIISHPCKYLWNVANNKDSGSSNEEKEIPTTMAVKIKCV